MYVQIVVNVLVGRSDQELNPNAPTTTRSCNLTMRLDENKTLSDIILDANTIVAKAVDDSECSCVAFEPIDNDQVEFLHNNSVEPNMVNMVAVYENNVCIKTVTNVVV